MSDKPKYRMPVSPLTGKRVKMTEGQIREYASMKGEGGTCSFSFANLVMTATDYLEKHPEVAHED